MKIIYAKKDSWGKGIDIETGIFDIAHLIIDSYVLWYFDTQILCWYVKLNMYIY